MTVTQLEKAKRPEKRRERLPLVLEILPGQAAEGLVVVFEPGDYEHLSLKELAEDALSRRNLSIEEQMILEDIHRQLQGGKLKRPKPARNTFMYRSGPSSPRKAGSDGRRATGRLFDAAAVEP